MSDTPTGEGDAIDPSAQDGGHHLYRRPTKLSTTAAALPHPLPGRTPRCTTAGQPSHQVAKAQWLPGYCLLLTDQPDIERLSERSRSERSDFLPSMADLGEAVERACRASDSAFRRVIIEILGNADRYLQAHVWPRYGWEDAELIVRPVWLYPAEKWRDPNTLLGPQYSALRTAIATELLASR